MPPGTGHYPSARGLAKDAEVQTQMMHLMAEVYYGLSSMPGPWRGVQ
jgi:hypothetical protein